MFDYRFVSLQYGDDGPHPERFTKPPALELRDSINPLKDMDGWLSQVAAMDAVVSHNTTVHGAGGLASLQCAPSAIKAIGDGLILRFTKVILVPISDACYQTSNSDWKPALAKQSTGYKNVSKIDRRLALSPRFKPLNDLL